MGKKVTWSDPGGLFCCYDDRMFKDICEVKEKILLWQEKYHILIQKIDKLPDFSKYSDLPPSWFKDLIKRLLAEMEDNLLRGERSLHVPDIVVCALAARNMLEIFIWICFCMKSDANARRLHLDFIRDSIDLNRIMVAFYSNSPPDIFTPIADSISEMAAEVGVEEGDRRYKRIDRAADEAGLTGLYKTMNTALSKFAHPTALKMGLDLSAENVMLLSLAQMEMSMGIATESVDRVRKSVQIILARQSS
jgi:hypothetical protein